ncbi:MAG: UDP-N-acetylmuramoyl-L-alanyl-D-glutamate--2,6-diaminopimelate ligase [Clostridia bacterium]|nr:UDP-N-acetylmuramoyl-L-alanyl-D-glutamate--2,6-diaminopimelate ligase [Clostridia bacterium]
MKLSKLISNIDVKKAVNINSAEIKNICYDSRKITENCVFVCLKGINYDGHDYAKYAAENGATAIIAEKEIEILNVPLIVVEDTRECLAKISANFFDNPAEKLTTIGITGTKGKTTTSFMIKSILESSGEKCGLIGTIGAIYGENITKLENTTPESYEIQRHMKNMLDLGYKYVIMEASSIGLKTHRLDGFDFDIGVFTNFSHDHIGGAEHKDMEEYLQCKSLLFQKCKKGIINIDDKAAEKMTKNSTCDIYTFGKNKNADYQMENIKLQKSKNSLGVEANFTGKISLKNVYINVPGEFNAYNALAAVSVCDALNINPNAIFKGLASVKIKGRMEPVNASERYSMFIDYAHNAVSMENVLSTLKKYSPKKLTVLFGAGGNRPKIRRYEMGETAGKLADLSIITSDNPRYENPLDIIEDIKTGINKTSGKYIVIPDRKQAIEYAMKNADDGEIIVLAGKGHEDYQEINGIKHKMDERIIVKDILEKQKNFK